MERIAWLPPKRVTLEEVASNALEPSIISNSITRVSPQSDYIGSTRERLVSISTSKWEQARSRLALLQPLLTQQPGVTVSTLADEIKVAQATVYRWLKAYRANPCLEGLISRAGEGRKGSHRLLPAVEAIVQEVIDAEYLTAQCKTAAKVLQHIKIACAEHGLKPPCRYTLDRRLEAVPAEVKISRRKGRQAADNLFRPINGSIAGADAPLNLVQLDHTQADIVLVDAVYRLPVGRPWLTIALDVYSRMVIGLYLSFEAPGANATGLCLLHAILPKQQYLQQLGVSGSWPCCGFMQAVHTDNAAEFTGLMLERACELHKIRQERRVPGIPHLGAHIERLIGTLMRETHSLPGTTFSNVSARGRYKPEQQACMTLKEYERWLVSYLVGVYHQQVHRGIGESPQVRYQRGLANLPIQLQPRQVADEQQLRMDFMPGIERTIQPYGVRIGHLHYYADILRPFINRIDPQTRKKQVFLFKRDPRDISILYFCDPKSKQYHRVPFRDRSQKTMSEYEYNEVLKRLREGAKKELCERDIFAAQKQLTEQVVAAASTTQKVRMTKTKNRIIQRVTVVTSLTDEEKVPVQKSKLTAQPLSIDPIQPYDELELGSLNS